MPDPFVPADCLPGLADDWDRYIGFDQGYTPTEAATSCPPAWSCSEGVSG